MYCLFRVARSLVLCVACCWSLFVFVFFFFSLLAIESGIETRCSGGVSNAIFINDSCGECLISNYSNTTDAIS
jgi:hypothetical protein